MRAGARTGLEFLDQAHCDAIDCGFGRCQMVLYTEQVVQYAVRLYMEVGDNRSTCSDWNVAA